MPSKERYARQKAAAAAKGTTPYQQRVRSARRRYGPSASLEAIRGHPGEVKAGQEPLSAAEVRRRSLSHRRRARELREAFGVQPTDWCVVCGANIPLTPGVKDGDRSRPLNPPRPRPGSYDCRPCNAERMRRFRRFGEEYGWFYGVDKLAHDEVWVAGRRRESREAGIPMQTPTGVEVA